MTPDYNDGISVSDLRMHFAYDPMTGILTTRTRRRNLVHGQRVGCIDRHGYIVTSLFKRPLKVHRIAWALTYGAWPVACIDHINGDKTDNRIINLREATNAQNKQNLSVSAANKSGFLGVSFNRRSQKWVANIKVDGKSIYLGAYDNKDDAAKAYLTAKAEMHPFWAEAAQ